MADLKENRKLIFYECGLCGTKIHYAKNSKPPIPCPDCGWMHYTRKYDDVPAEIKISLNKPSMT